MGSFSLIGNIADIFNNKIFYGEVIINDSRIQEIKIIENNIRPGTVFILPGFVDSHVHIESSMLVPSEFARLAVVHGTIGTISDPHEIANVCGIKGIEYMINNGKTVPFKFYFGAPSCVPATQFETAGASINAKDVEALLQKKEIAYLSEVMNFPGVLNKEEEIIKKIEAAKSLGKPVDGHAPGLRGEEARQYINAGISTDHECFTYEEASEKLSYGMKILIREGSAAKNFDALIGLLNDHPENMMFCSDDKHPDSLEHGHINLLCARAVKKEIDIFKILRAACVNPVLHYNMDVGLLRVNDKADLIIVEDLENFKVLETFIDGEPVAKNGKSLIQPGKASLINHFNCDPVKPEDLEIKATIKKNKINVIEAIDGQLITNKFLYDPYIQEGCMISNVKDDVLKIAVVNRYNKAPVALAFIKNFGLKKGAIASSVAHDSHNIVAIGVDDISLSKAINLVIQQQGGISAVDEKDELLLALPVAGLMSNLNGYEVAAAYTSIDAFAKEILGSTLTAPFMSLSFMALLVIPSLKLSDKGLFDGESFSFVENN
ncbi:MAG: adenine deaminase [Ferruginibacter sp.]